MSGSVFVEAFPGGGTADGEHVSHVLPGCPAPPRLLHRIYDPEADLFSRLSQLAEPVERVIAPFGVVQAHLLEPLESTDLGVPLGDGLGVGLVLLAAKDSAPGTLNGEPLSQVGIADLDDRGLMRDGLCHLSTSTSSIPYVSSRPDKDTP